MDRYLLKNIIIIILILVNGFLLGSLVMRQTAEYSAQRRTEQHLIELFEADGILLNEDAISHGTPPSPRMLTADARRQTESAAFFLGNNLLEDDQGGTLSLTGSSGIARFRSGGSFEIEGKLASEDAEKLCESFCKTFSFDPPVFELDETGSGSGFAVFRHEGLPVYNCTLTFTLKNGTLNRVNGTLLSGESTAFSPEREPLSGIAALTAFQKTRRESGAVVSSVSELYLCYELSASSGGSILEPSWCVVTDTSKYYVNASSGAVTSG